MRKRKSGVILLYHRIAEPERDPFELAVSSRRFVEHLDVLQTLGRIESLTELARSAGSRSRDRSFALTFDDGYLDNLSTAKPILEERGLPATVFVTTGFVGGQPFWWDELVGLLLTNSLLPERIVLDVAGFRRSWDVAATTPERVFEGAWTLLLEMNDDSRRLALADLRGQVGLQPQSGARSLTASELRDLARGEVVSIGAHTRTHPVLAQLSDDAARAEVRGSKEWLEELLDEPVRTFSYPYGGTTHYGGHAVEVVRAAGFEFACTGEPGVVTDHADPLQLPRLTVKDWNGETLEREIAALTRRRRRW